MISLLVVATLGQYRSCVTSYAQQTYSQPTYQTYANNPYVEKTIFVAVENAQDYYGGLVGQAYRNEQRTQQAQRSQQDINGKLDRLTQLVESLQKRLEATEPTLPPKAQLPEPNSSAGVYPASEAVPPPPMIASAATSQHAEKATKILSAHCAKCHTGEATAGGGNQIFNVDGSMVKLEPADWLLIDQAIYSGSMPKGGIPLTSEEYSVVRARIDELRSEIASTLRQAKGKKS